MRRIFWAAFVCLALAMPAQSQEPDANAILGEWAGRYDCASERLEATVTLKLRGQIREGVVSLTLPGTRKPAAVFTVRANLRQDGLIELAMVSWRQNPNGYKPVNLLGQVSPDGKRYTGDIQNCGSFEFSRTKPPSKEDLERIARGEDDPRKHKEKACQALPDYGKRMDCIVEARNTPRFGRGIPNQLLRKACESAFRNFDPESTPECLGGILFIDGRGGTGSDFLKGISSCREFVGRAHGMIERKFPLEAAASWRRDVTGPKTCENLDGMRVPLGMPALSTCKRSAGNIGEELVNCSGTETTDPEFARMWKAAFEECGTGKQIGMYRTIKKARYENFQAGLFDLSCADVFALVEKHKIVDRAEIDRGRQQMAALEGKRPPRDDEVIEALKVAITRKYSCDDGGHQFNRERFGCNIGYGRSRDGAAIADEINKIFGRIMNDGVTVNLGLVGAELFSCAASGSSYTCTYGIELTCSFTGMVAAPHPDPTALASAKIHCGRYTEPYQRQSVFTWEGGRYVTNL
ncbi:hypothetical protein [Neorhizobium galegae]|uniref:hypothetical protein n=1 Tax=Neorhizobium galegae TaxID=399 RepID=UPI002102D178|nr:hypothetical protein [Neorhizobium galegae]MCQ1833818.1 hypothetical protein [Neorhizobium galegae]